MAGSWAPAIHFFTGISWGLSAFAELVGKAAPLASFHAMDAACRRVARLVRCSICRGYIGPPRPPRYLTCSTSVNKPRGIDSSGERVTGNRCNSHSCRRGSGEGDATSFLRPWQDHICEWRGYRTRSRLGRNGTGSNDANAATRFSGMP